MAKIVGLDTSLFIYLFEEHPLYLKKVEKIFYAVSKGKSEGIIASVGMIEILTGPKKQGRADLAGQYEFQIRNFPNLSVVGMNEHIIWLASDLRAKYGITTPDAIHVATAIDCGASRFITNDRALKKVKEIAVELL